MTHSLLVIFTLLLLSLCSTPVHAGRLYLAPATGSVQADGTLTVSIRTDTETIPINVVSTSIAYPPTLVTLTEMKRDTSSFPVIATSTITPGQAKITQGLIGNGVIGDHEIAKLIFKPTAGSGQFTITIASASALIDSVNQTNTFTKSTGGTYTILPAPTTTPIVNTVLGTVTPTPRINMPRFSDISVTDVTYTSAVIQWKTDIPASSFVEYGTDGVTYPLSATGATNTQQHLVEIKKPPLIPGTTYHFRVRSVEGKTGKENVSGDQTFTTKGYQVKVIIQDEYGMLTPGTDVLISSANGDVITKTSKDGTVLFDNISPGQKTIMAKISDKTYTKNIQINSVIPSDPAISIVPQSLIIKVAGAYATKQKSPWLFFAFVAAIILIALLLAVYYMKKQKNVVPLQTTKSSISTPSLPPPVPPSTTQ